MGVSKYEPLWRYIQNNAGDSLRLSFENIGEIAGVPLDHSFLQYKGELIRYGWQVQKISMKEKTVLFQRLR